MKTIIFVPRTTFDFITFALETKIMIFFIFVWGRIITRNNSFGSIKPIQNLILYALKTKIMIFIIFVGEQKLSFL